MNRSSFLRALALAAGVLALGPFARAQDAGYPSKPIRVVIPSAPGGGTDFISRLLSTKLGESTGWTFVPDNRAGAVVGHEGPAGRLAELGAQQARDEVRAAAGRRRDHDADRLAGVARVLGPGEGPEGQHAGGQGQGAKEAAAVHGEVSCAPRRGLGVERGMGAAAAGPLTAAW